MSRRRRSRRSDATKRFNAIVRESARRARRARLLKLAAVRRKESYYDVDIYRSRVRYVRQRKIARYYSAVHDLRREGYNTKKYRSKRGRLLLSYKHPELLAGVSLSGGPKDGTEQRPLCKERIHQRSPAQVRNARAFYSRFGKRGTSGAKTREVPC